MKKIVEVKHHEDNYECMWNGIEDLYMEKTGEHLAPNLFFLLSGFGSFCYMKTAKADLKRMVALGDGRTKKMYEFLAPIVGFTYQHHEYKTFEQALMKAKRELDAGYPTILGALDMYYLSYYPKLYHGEHIPFHYVMMVGYDDEEQLVYVLDCGREETQTLSYEELCLAWNCSYPGLSKPNTVCSIRMNAEKSTYQITKEALIMKGKMFLEPAVGFVGYKGFEKFIKELPKWRVELSKKEYDDIMANLITFFGTVPTTPNALKGIDEPDEMTFHGGFDKMSLALKILGEEYQKKTWIEASICFDKGSFKIAEITDIIVHYLIHKEDAMNRLPVLFKEVLDLMKEGYTLLCEEDRSN